MSSVITSPERRAATPATDVVESLRCPGERAAFVVCAASNFVVVAAAMVVLVARPTWLDAHPVLAARLDVIRGIVLAAILAVPGAGLLRHVTFHRVRTGGVRVGERQFPELHAQLLAACEKLRFEHVPEVYLTREIDQVVAEAHTLWGGRAVVAINAEFVDENWVEGLDWLTFAMVGALGSIRLGHTRWWVELLTVYARRIPGLRTPTLVRWTYSRDRCAAYVVPDGIRGLVVEAVGNHALPAVDVPAFVAQTERAAGMWDRVANVVRRRPSLVARARALYAAGLLDRARDRERHPFAPPVAG